MPELHLRQVGLTYSAFGPFTKHHEKITKFKETDNLNYIYKKELDKACFAHDTVYDDSKDLAKNLKDTAYEIARHSKYEGHQRELSSMVCKFFDKKI